MTRAGRENSAGPRAFIRDVGRDRAGDRDQRGVTGAGWARRKSPGKAALTTRTTMTTHPLHRNLATQHNPSGGFHVKSQRSNLECHRMVKAPPAEAPLAAVPPPGRPASQRHRVKVEVVMTQEPDLKPAAATRSPRSLHRRPLRTQEADDDHARGLRHRDRLSGVRRDDLVELVGARYWAPSRVRGALRKLVDEGRAHPLSHATHALPDASPTRSRR